MITKFKIFEQINLEIDPYGEEIWEDKIDKIDVQGGDFEKLRDVINLIIEHYNDIYNINLTTQYMEQNVMGYGDKQINIKANGEKIMDICKIPETFVLAISAGTKNWPYGMRHMNYYDYEEQKGIIKKIRRKLLELIKVIK